MAFSSTAFFRRWIPALFWGLAILFLSLTPGGAGDLNFFGIPHFDKLGHFGMYSVWTFLFVYALAGQPGRSSAKIIMGSVFMGALAGIALEYGQYFMGQGRSFELADMVANIAGAGVGSWMGWLLLLREKGQQ